MHLPQCPEAVSVPAERFIAEENQMKQNSLFKLAMCTAFLSLFLFWGVAGAQETETKGSENPLLDVLKEAVGKAANEAIEDQIDELKGTFAGEISDIRLIERRGRSAIFEVTYKEVKDTNGLKLVGEVLRGGSPSELIGRATTDIGARQGKLRLLFEKGSAAADGGWGIETDTASVHTDQVRLTFVRETHPDEPFGQYLFDFDKTWTDSEELDVIDTQTAEDESVALAEGEQSATPPVLVMPGTSIKPVVVAKPVTLAKPKAVAVKPASQSTATVSPAAGAMRLQPIDATRPLALNAYAAKASWQSGAGKLAFPGLPHDRQGYVRIVAKANLSTGNMAVDLLNTHPQWKSRGRIAGTFPAMKLGNKMRLKSVIGFLQGAGESDGARFMVAIKADGRTRRVYAKQITPKKYENVNIDLSAWSGKVVQIILRVDAGAHSRQDYAVWVKPRLDIAP
jgi:hypothetical protein